jgi:hypothetical protein
MTRSRVGPLPGQGSGPFEMSFPGGNDGPSSAPEIAPAQAKVLRLVRLERRG